MQGVAACGASGARQAVACKTVRISVRTYQRWRLRPSLEDLRQGPLTPPSHSLSALEKERIVKVATSTEFCDYSPNQIVPRLADQGKWVASESSFYRVLKKKKMLTHRQRSRPPQERNRPAALEATAANQVFSWDISYLPTTVRGLYFYLYLFIDIYSRKIVGWKIHDREAMELSADLLNEICIKENIDKNQLVLHADNGGAMKGSTMLVTMQRLGVASSFSRPAVSNDNPFSEALFRTVKYCNLFPSKPFAALEESVAWMVKFEHWYNTQHLHSGIKFVTPSARHKGKDLKILEKRKEFYQQLKMKHPLRWSKNHRNWDLIKSVKLNFLKTSTP